MVESSKYDVAGGRGPFGPSSLCGLTGVLDEVWARGVLLITDPARADLAQQIKEMLGGRVAGHYDDITQHIPVPGVEGARQLVSDFDVDRVLTVGGGSTAGMGKAVCLTIDATCVPAPATFARSQMTSIWGMSDGGHKQTGRGRGSRPTRSYTRLDVESVAAMLDEAFHGRRPAAA